MTRASFGTSGSSWRSLPTAVEWEKAPIIMSSCIIDLKALTYRKEEETVTVRYALSTPITVNRQKNLHCRMVTKSHITLVRSLRTSK